MPPKKSDSSSFTGSPLGFEVTAKLRSEGEPLARSLTHGPKSISDGFLLLA